MGREIGGTESLAAKGSTILDVPVGRVAPSAVLEAQLLKSNVGFTGTFTGVGGRIQLTGASGGLTARPAPCDGPAAQRRRWTPRRGWNSFQSDGISPTTGRFSACSMPPFESPAVRSA